jgi:NADPH2:quinone reductase
VDLVVDSVGTTLEGSIAAAAYRGRVVSVGNAGRAEARPIDISTMSQMNKSLTGVFFGGEMMMRPDRARALVQGLIEDVAAKKLRVAIDRTYPLSEAAKAHAYIESRQAFGRVLLIP